MSNRLIIVNNCNRWRLRHCTVLFGSPLIVSSRNEVPVSQSFTANGNDATQLVSPLES